MFFRGSLCAMISIVRVSAALSFNFHFAVFRFRVNFMLFFMKYAKLSSAGLIFSDAYL